MTKKDKCEDEEPLIIDNTYEETDKDIVIDKLKEKFNLIYKQ